MQIVTFPFLKDIFSINAGVNIGVLARLPNTDVNCVTFIGLFLLMFVSVPPQPPFLLLSSDILSYSEVGKVPILHANSLII